MFFNFLITWLLFVLGDPGTVPRLQKHSVERGNQLLPLRTSLNAGWALMGEPVFLKNPEENAVTQELLSCTLVLPCRRALVMVCPAAGVSIIPAD